MKRELGIVGAFAALSLGAALTASADRPAGTTILWIGDSHSVGTFGRSADALLRALPLHPRVWFYASSSATPNYYFAGTSSHGGFFHHPADAAPEMSRPGVPDAPTPKLSERLALLNPQVTIVALGTNDLPGADEEGRIQVRKTIEAIRSHGSGCVWVGPPDEGFTSHERQDRFYATVLAPLTTELGCTLVDSRRWTHYPALGGDRRHYDSLGGAGIEQAKKWAQGVADRLMEFLAAQAAQSADSSK